MTENTTSRKGKAFMLYISENQMQYLNDKSIKTALSKSDILRLLIEKAISEDS